MRQYILRRLLLMIPLLFTVSLLIFLLLRVMPGDVMIAILGGVEGEGAKLSPEQTAAIRKEWGLDKPIHVQYMDWVSGVVQGDFGRSFWYKTSISADIAKRYPVTLELALLAMLVSLLIALPVGIISAIKQDTWVDYLFRVVSIGGLAVPSFWLGILMLLAMVVWFRWTPPFGYVSIWENPTDNFLQFIWPALALGYALSAIVSRMTRSQLLEVLREDYIRTAWAKGLRERSVVLRHALKNALLPVITVSSLQLGFLMGGTVIMETVFVLPGLGRSLVDAILHRDYPYVQAIVLLICSTFMVVNLCVDLLYAWLDPRIRYT